MEIPWITTIAASKLEDIALNALAAERLRRFKRNKLGFISTWIFAILFLTSLFAEFLANDKPLILVYNGKLYMPVFVDYPETVFGGTLEISADYRDSYVSEIIESRGWMLWPPVRFSYSTINYDLPTPAPSPPTRANLLGTDDRGRDVLARIIYGFRISVLFGLTLTVVSAVIGVSAGAFMGCYGRLDWIYWDSILLSSGAALPTLLHFDNPVQCCSSQLLTVAGNTSPFYLDEFCGCGSCRIPALP